ncbi:MAG: hypothetical protein H5U03_10270, partial [Clostridia bacterium]|nr:hypothetical protein [Clostridia bacterium]
MLFGDSVPHEPDLFGRDYGVDPGVDAVLGTEDDLRLASVLEYLRDSLIQVIGVYSDSREEVRWFFEQVAEETGGQAYYISDTSQIPATVAQGLEIAATEIGQLDVAPSLEISPWLEISPSKHLDVQPGDALSFHVRIAVPEDAVPGNYAGPLEVRGDGAV